jgi:hypothetical protein
MIGVSRGTSSTSVGAMELHAICLDHVRNTQSTNHKRVDINFHTTTSIKRVNVMNKIKPNISNQLNKGACYSIEVLATIWALDKGSVSSFKWHNINHEKQTLNNFISSYVKT